MRVVIFSRNSDRIAPLLAEAGFSLVEKDPDFVVTFGGDGTIVHAEYAWPGVPKIILKDSLICKKCDIASGGLDNSEFLARIRAGKYGIEDVMKLEVLAMGERLVAMNDITVHNADPRRAIRYNVALDDEPLQNDVIGDGVVVASPFGSTGYYRSITDSYFETGIGLAFNNSTEQADHVVLHEDRVIALAFTRGPATIYADNQEGTIVVPEGETVTIRKAAEVAKIVKAEI